MQTTSDEQASQVWHARFRKRETKKRRMAEGAAPRHRCLSQGMELRKISLKHAQHALSRDK